MKSISKAEWVLFILQGYMVLFLALHDWVKIGPFTDPDGFDNANTLKEAILQTVGNTLPILFSFLLAIMFAGKTYPLAARIYLMLVYPIYLFGEFQAWWLPYFFGKTIGRDFEETVARYQVMFGETHAFLPEMNGIVVNTAHVFLHSATMTSFFIFLYLFFKKNNQTN